jgi:hypothetical protein
LRNSTAFIVLRRHASCRLVAPAYEPTLVGSLRKGAQSRPSSEVLLPEHSPRLETHGVTLVSEFLLPSM